MSDQITPIDQQRQPVFVYVLSDPITKERRYIGITKMPRKRLIGHCNEKTGSPRSQWIQELRRNGHRPKMKILAKIPYWADVAEFEKMWIKYAFDAGWNILNATTGGQGTKGMSDETKRKIGDSRRGHKKTPYELECASKSGLRNIGRKRSQEFKDKLRKAHTGKVVSEETKGRVSESTRTVSAEKVAAVLEMIAAGIPQSEIARRIGVAQPTISAIKNGKRLYMRRSGDAS